MSTDRKHPIRYTVQDRKPRLLDLFCVAGGAAVGYHRAGFNIIGIDNKPQPNYPFTYIQADAIEALESWVRRGKFHGISLSDFTAIHASPPCQAYSITNNIWKATDKHPDLVGPVRNLLRQAKLPFVIENVPGAPLENPVVLCGVMFGLNVIRHRLFESQPAIEQPPHKKHEKRASYGRTPKNGEYFTISGHFGDIEGGRRAMGIQWMNRPELAQAIPPAYTEFIGKQLFKAIGGQP